MENVLSVIHRFKRLTRVLDTDHIKNEIKQKNDEQTKELNREGQSKREEESFLEEKERKVAAAEKFLASNSISNLQDITTLEKTFFIKGS